MAIRRKALRSSAECPGVYAGALIEEDLIPLSHWRPAAFFDCHAPSLTFANRALAYFDRLHAVLGFQPHAESTVTTHHDAQTWIGGALLDNGAAFGAWLLDNVVIGKRRSNACRCERGASKNSLHEVSSYDNDVLTFNEYRRPWFLPGGRSRTRSCILSMKSMRSLEANGRRQTSPRSRLRHFQHDAREHASLKHRRALLVWSLADRLLVERGIAFREFRRHGLRVFRRVRHIPGAVHKWRITGLRLRKRFFLARATGFGLERLVDVLLVLGRARQLLLVLLILLRRWCGGLTLSRGNAERCR